MKNHAMGRSQFSQNLSILALGFLILCQTTSAEPVENNNHTSEIFVKRLTSTNTPGESPVSKIFKLTQDGKAEEVPPSTFTLKSDTVNVRSDSKTSEDRENLRNLLPSKTEPDDKKSSKINDDSESRLFMDDDGFPNYGVERYHFPSKRSDDDYYADEMMAESSHAVASTALPPKEEEESFFSIFESLFGSSDDESQSKKKSHAEEDRFKFKEPEDETIKENIKTVGDILKPLKPVEEPESKSKNSYLVYHTDIPEYRIVNNFHQSQSQGQAYKTPDRYPSYHSSYRPALTERPYPPYKTHSTSGYEDYDLEEFMDKTDSVTRVKYMPPVTTSGWRDPVNLSSKGSTATTARTPLTTIPTATTAALTTTTTKVHHENKVKFPSVQKKSDYINKNRYQEVFNEVTEKKNEKETERTTHLVKPEVKSTTEKLYTVKNPQDYQEISKLNEIKLHKVQESPNFYNLINLPVRYSTKDTAIPLISHSYANTKIQGMGALKYDKGSNGKYPNHKYEQTSVVTTQKPSYWATKRTESTIAADAGSTTEKYSFANENRNKPAPNYVSSKDFEKMEFDGVQIGMGPEFGGYGNKKGAENNAPQQTTSRTFHKETTTKRNDPTVKINENKDGSDSLKPISDQKKYLNKGENNKYTPQEYDYDIVPAKVHEFKPLNPSQPPQAIYGKEGQHKNEVEYNKDVVPLYRETYENGPDSEIPEYEYYDYDFDVSTTTAKPSTTTTTTTTTTKTTTTTPAPTANAKLKPNPPKELLKAEPSHEKVAVVVATKDQSYYTENHLENSQPPNFVVSSLQTTTSSPTTAKTTITTTTTPKPIPTTTLTTKQTDNDGETQYKRPEVEIQKVNFVSKQPAPVFDKGVHDRPTTKDFYAEKSAVDATTIEPIVVTSFAKQKQDEQESNVNVMLVPTEKGVKNAEKIERTSAKTEYPAKVSSNYQTNKPSSYSPANVPSNFPPKIPSNIPIHSPASVQSIPPTNTYVYTSFVKPNGPYPPGYSGYTTEFTVGAAQGHGGNSIYQTGINNPSPQGHFVASSIATNPYGNDEPFRPIPKPSGMTASFQVVRDDGLVQQQHVPNQNSVPAYQNKRPILLSTSSADRIREPGHESHEFVPSPQFHRPSSIKPKPVPEVRPSDVDYEFDGIQTQPKPGQYVIFSKPQLNPELHENQLKKKPETTAPKPSITNAPVFHDTGSLFSHESQEHVIFNPKEGQFYHSGSGKKPIVPEKPTYSTVEDELPLQLVPPRGIQTEKPYDRNYVTPETDNKESTVSYPRPHWEKNGKPSFLFNTMPNKNDMNRGPPVGGQMTQSLIPPSNIPPQKFRRPPPPHLTPSRKTFNEATTNVKLKQNLPNILPQFRPTTKVGPYHRPNAYPNRRHGMNRYRENEHKNFPYHIQYPDKENLAPREYEMGPEIVPKFITNRGKLPSEVWNSGMQKRFGQSPPNAQTKLDTSPYPPQGPKLLKRLQRNPVTTLQMLKHVPGVMNQRIPPARESDTDQSESLVPPIYRTFPDPPKPQENLYIVYPSKAPQKVLPNDEKVFIVSDETQNHQSFLNFTKYEEQVPLLKPIKRIHLVGDKLKLNFPYGFIKTEDKEDFSENEAEKSDAETYDVKREETVQNYKILSRPKEESIDMNLHMQSNNQWNEVRSTPLAMISKGPKTEERHAIQVHPPSEYRTSIRGDGKDSAFTLGAMMHAATDIGRKGEVANVPINESEKKISLPQLSVNERISNGKIITVSLPLDVKEDKEKGSEMDTQGFKAPFHASSSVDVNSYSPNEGWTVVRGPENKVDEEEEEKQTTEASTTRFSFENFKPELIGGFRPIFEHLEEEEKKENSETPTESVSEKEEKVLSAR